MTVLEDAIGVAKKNKISTIVVASTSGGTALKLFELVRDNKLRMIVVTHDEGRSLKERRFSEDIRRMLLANNITVYTRHPRSVFLKKITGKILEKLMVPSWHKHLREIIEKHGTGIKVYHIIIQILMEGGIFKEGKVVAIAGAKNGADSAAVFVVSQKAKWPILEDIITSP
jgi:hypothetical protein